MYSRCPCATHGVWRFHVVRRSHVLIAVLIAVSVLMLVSASPVFAGGYADWADVVLLPGNGTSPHGGYTASTNKCGVCHAVHGADATGEVLLRSPVADACIYCHVSTAVSSLQVYDADPANYNGTDYDNAHNFGFASGTGDGWPGVKCTTCHQVHAADEQMTSNAFLTQKILRGDKTNASSAYDIIAGAPLVGDDKETALTKWCAGCHATMQFVEGDPGYYSDVYSTGIMGEGDGNKESHIMTTADANYANPVASFTGQVAWKDSSYCMSCHASGYDDGSSDWPHFTDGDKFLVSAADSTVATAAATDSSQDGVCLRCHRDGSTGAGIGY